VEMRRLLRQIAQLGLETENPCCVVRKSTIPGANNGVFVTRSVEAGQVLCLYPGRYYAPPPITSSFDGSPPLQVSDLNDARLKGSVYIMGCTNGGFIDAANLELVHPLSCGHIVNHSRRLTNAEPQTFVWSDFWDLRAQFQSSPNLHFFRDVNVLDKDAIWFLNHEGKPVNYSNNCVAIKGIAIVSTAPIERGSEVFIDYKFSNDHVRNLDWYREE